MGRYRIIPGPPVHKSKTCTLVFAEDLTNNRLVALKIMKHRHQFKAEIDARYNNGSPLSSSFVISLLGWHCPAGDPISDAGGQAPWEEATETSEEGGEATYVLVMPQGERSLHDACAKERIAGIDADAVMAIVLHRLDDSPHGSTDSSMAIRQCGKQELVGRHRELRTSSAKLAGLVVTSIHCMLQDIVGLLASVRRGLTQLDDRPKRVMQRLW